MFSRFLLLSFVSVFWNLTLAQELFKPLRSSGPVPKEFRTSSEEKIRERENLYEGKEGWEKKIREDFILTDTYFLGKMLSSGRILFGDPVTRLANSIKDTLLKEHPGLADKIRIYTIRSGEVNAFATQSGILFITTGLMAKLESEAQLAFILSHEIVHYTNRHNINSYVQEKESLRNRSGQKQYSFKEKLLARHSYSRELETESDTEGLTRYYLNSPFTLKAADEVFDVLRYSDLPYANRPFRYELFESSMLKIPEELRLKEIPEVDVDDDYDDSMLSHPNIRKRKEQMESLLAGKSDEGRKRFLFDSLEFDRIRKSCRYDLVHTFVIDGDFSEAIYQISLLSEVYGMDEFLESKLLASVYGLAVMRTYNLDVLSLNASTNIAGNLNSVFNLFRKLNAEQTSLIALHQALRFAASHPDDQYSQAIIGDLMSDLVREHKVGLDKFYKQPKSELLAELGEPETVETETAEAVNIFGEAVGGNSETTDEKATEKKFSSREYRRLNNYRNFVYFAFQDQLKDSSFTTRYSAYEKTFAEEERIDSLLTKKEKREKDQLAWKTYKANRPYGPAMGRDTLMVLDPVYLRRIKKDAETDYLSSLQYQYNLREDLQKQEEHPGLQTEFFSLNAIGENDTERFNETTTLRDWTTERMAFEGVPMVSSQFYEMNELSEKYKTDKLLMPAVISTRINNEFRRAYRTVMYSVLIVTIPLAVFELVRKQHITEYYYMVFDTKTGEMMNTGYSRRKGKDSYQGSKTRLIKAMNRVKEKPATVSAD